MVQIEDPEPMEELEAIAALDGIDMMFFDQVIIVKVLVHPASSIIQKLPRRIST
jgi:2-keto-3-deoxy-L-rhamnonate aldolase RhmA